MNDEPFELEVTTCDRQRLNRLRHYRGLDAICPICEAKAHIAIDPETDTWMFIHNDLHSYGFWQPHCDQVPVVPQAIRNIINRRTPQLSSDEQTRRKRESLCQFPKALVCRKTGERFPNVAEAASHKGLNEVELAKAATNPELTCGGSHWVYE